MESFKGELSLSLLFPKKSKHNFAILCNLLSTFTILTPSFLNILFCCCEKAVFDFKDRTKQTPHVNVGRFHQTAFFNVNNFLLFRYEVLYHESCLVGCPTGMPESGINTGLSRRYTVEGLSPYTMYNFRIRVYNTLHSSFSDELSVQTKASGTLSLE